MTASGRDLPCATELGLVPGLDAAELRRVYRDLARRYHPDSGSAASGEMMRHINSLHDILKKELEVASPQDTRPFRARRPASPARATMSDIHRMDPRAEATKKPVSGLRLKPEASPDAEVSLGELALTGTAREMMSAALIEAVDGWLVSNRGVPRNLLQRRMLVRLGRIEPTTCPGLHMPGWISMTRRALRFHFHSSPINGLNLVALPTLANDGTCLSPTGDVSVSEEKLETGQGRHAMPAETARARGFALTLDGRPLAVELLFSPGESNFGSGFHHLKTPRFRGLFQPP